MRVMDYSVGIGCSGAWAEGVEEMQVPRWINNCTTQQSALLYPKSDNSGGSDYAIAGSAELVEKLVSIMREGGGVLSGRDHDY